MQPFDNCRQLASDRFLAWPFDQPEYAVYPYVSPIESMASPHFNFKGRPFIYQSYPGRLLQVAIFTYLRNNHAVESPLPLILLLLITIIKPL